MQANDLSLLIVEAFDTRGDCKLFKLSFVVVCLIARKAKLLHLHEVKALKKLDKPHKWEKARFAILRTKFSFQFSIRHTFIVSVVWMQSEFEQVGVLDGFELNYNSIRSPK